MQLLIDQTNKREIADWLLQKSLPIILCNSIISIIEVHPVSSSLQLALISSIEEGRGWNKVAITEEL